MIRINILSAGFETPNARAFLYPFILWQDELRAAGLDCGLFRRADDDLADCDVLLVDSKVHRDLWAGQTAAIVEQFGAWAKRCRVIYCDTTDSSGWLQTALLPVVHGYAKAQVLRDRTRYLAPMYGHRPYADYYHRTFGIADADPEWSQPVPDAALLAKLRVSWNSGLADYSEWGPWRAELYRAVPLRALLRFPNAFTPPDTLRPTVISCRFGAGYPRASVAYQRLQIRERMAGRADTGKLGRRRYFRELRTSKVVVSPFGYGEITLKDFEVFLTGGLLLKADMSHMETWPDLFQAGETMLAYRWDLSDFVAVLEDAVADDARRRALAAAGQECYRAHIVGPRAAELFTEHLRTVIA